jgi:16S rRNA (guanine1207-N2)-methyltransferase
MFDPMAKLAEPFEAGVLEAPERICVLRARLGGFAPGRMAAEQGLKPVHDALAAAGYDVAPRREGVFPATGVALTRHKAENRANLARAWAMTEAGGPVLIAGAKTDGVESLQKAVRGLVEGVEPGGHGRVFWLRKGAETPAEFADWVAEAAPAVRIDGRWTTAAGMFSWTEVDPGSALLAEAMAGRLGGQVADLGAGWGYLGARALEDKGVAAVSLYEAEAAALDCARANVDDPRAAFHWADVAGGEVAKRTYDFVIANPPFHEGRSVSVGLGHGFLEAGAAALKPRGEMLIVANRTLPYEARLEELFTGVEALKVTGRYKVLRAWKVRRR